MAAIPITDPKVDDKVSVDHPSYPGIWIVKSLGPVNAKLEPVNGGRPLRAPLHLLIEPTEASAAAEPQVFYVPGELVRIVHGPYVGLYVVIADKGEKVNVAKLGGDEGRYVRSTRRGLVKVALDEVIRQ